MSALPYRRHQFSVDTANGSGQIAGVEWGADAGQCDILFLHANGFNAMTYNALLAPLGEQGLGEQGLRVLAVDLRGHGLTTLPADPAAIAPNWDVYRDDLICLLRSLGQPPRVLAGHSMGGAICLLAATSWPSDLGRAPSLVLFDPVLAPPRMGNAPSLLVAGALRRNNSFESIDAALISYAGRGAFKTWPEASIRDYLTDGLYWGEDQAHHLRCSPAWEANNFSHPHRAADASMVQLRSPLTVLRAAEGSTCHCSDWPPQAQVQTVPNSTHFMPIESPDLARTALQTAVQAERKAAMT